MLRLARFAFAAVALDHVIVVLAVTRAKVFSARVDRAQLQLATAALIHLTTLGSLSVTPWVLATLLVGYLQFRFGFWCWFCRHFFKGRRLSSYLLFFRLFYPRSRLWGLLLFDRIRYFGYELSVSLIQSVRRAAAQIIAVRQ